MVWLSKRQNPPNLGVDLWKWAYFVFRLKSSCLQVVRLGLPFPALGRLEVRISCCHWSWETVPGDACCYWWAWQSPHLVLVVWCWRSFKNNCVLYCSLPSKRSDCQVLCWCVALQHTEWCLAFVVSASMKWGAAKCIFRVIFIVTFSLPPPQWSWGIRFFFLFFFPPRQLANENSLHRNPNTAECLA